MPDKKKLMSILDHYISRSQTLRDFALLQFLLEVKEYVVGSIPVSGDILFNGDK